MPDALVTIQVSREELLRQDVSRVRRILDSFVPGLLKRNRNAISVEVMGYDDDPRELFLIPEVRKWFHRLFDVTPDWFYWMDMSNDRLLLHALMMFSPVRVEGGTTIRPEDVQAFLMWGFPGLNVFCKNLQIDPTLSSQHVFACVKAMNA